MKVLVPLATGFEEIEAITIIDILRRAGIDVTTAFTMTNPVKGSHNIEVCADISLEQINVKDFDMLVLPGGMPGSKHLQKDTRVIAMLQQLHAGNKYIAAICAAPIALGAANLLQGKKATCFPGYEPELTGALLTSDPVVVDGKIITAKGAGCAIDFTLALVAALKGKEISAQIRNALQVYWK